MKQYQFSVIIPAHNEENYIYKCLKSIRTAAKQVGSEKNDRPQQSGGC